MKLIPPPPPRSAQAGFYPAPEWIASELVHGIASGCVMCGHSVTTYWLEDERFHPLHEGCAARLVQHWRTLLDAGEDGRSALVATTATGGRLRGAYARRAARSGASTARVTSALAPVVPEVVRANRFFRPGMAPEALWTVVRETTVARHTTPRRSEVAAKELLSLQELAADTNAAELDAGIIPLGGCVVAPDGLIVAAWGQHSDPQGAPLFRPMSKLQAWQRCRGCDVWCWPGCWLVDGVGHCQDCAAPDDGRPWPVDPPAPDGRTEPPPPPPKKKVGKERFTD